MQRTDVQFIDVSNMLRDKIVVHGSGPLDLSPVEEAERALQELSDQFDDWLAAETLRLNEARNKVREHGFVTPFREGLIRAAHDVKGGGKTMGYPLATVIGASLCNLLMTCPDDIELPVECMDHHVDAISRLVGDKITDEHDPMASAVADRLMVVVDEFVKNVEAKAAPEAANDHNGTRSGAEK